MLSFLAGPLEVGGCGGSLRRATTCSPFHSATRNYYNTAGPFVRPCNRLARKQLPPMHVPRRAIQRSPNLVTPDLPGEPGPRPIDYPSPQAAAMLEITKPKRISPTLFPDDYWAQVPVEPGSENDETTLAALEALSDLTDYVVPEAAAPPAPTSNDAAAATAKVAVGSRKLSAAAAIATSGGSHLLSGGRFYRRFTRAEDKLLRRGFLEHGADFRAIAKTMLPHRKPLSLRRRWYALTQSMVRQKPFTAADVGSSGDGGHAGGAAPFAANGDEHFGEVMKMGLVPMGPLTLEENVQLVKLTEKKGGLHERTSASAARLPKRPHVLTYCRYASTLKPRLQMVEFLDPDWRRDIRGAVQRALDDSIYEAVWNKLKNGTSPRGSTDSETMNGGTVGKGESPLAPPKDASPAHHLRRWRGGPKYRLPWTVEESQRLLEAIETMGTNWSSFQHEFPMRSAQSLAYHYWNVLSPMRAQGEILTEPADRGEARDDSETDVVVFDKSNSLPWTREEDDIIMREVNKHWATQAGIWVHIHQVALPQRSPREIRDRWRVIDPLGNHWTEWMPSEEELLRRAVERFGPSFPAIRKLDAFQARTLRQLANKWKGVGSPNGSFTLADSTKLRALVKQGKSAEDLIKVFDSIDEREVTYRYRMVSAEFQRQAKGYQKLTRETVDELVQLYEAEVESLRVVADDVPSAKASAERASATRAAAPPDADVDEPPSPPTCEPGSDFWFRLAERYDRPAVVLRNTAYARTGRTLIERPLRASERAFLETRVDQADPGRKSIGFSSLSRWFKPPRRPDSIKDYVRRRIVRWTPRLDAALLEAVTRVAPEVVHAMEEEKRTAAERLDAEFAAAVAKGEELLVGDDGDYVGGGGGGGDDNDESGELLLDTAASWCSDRGLVPRRLFGITGRRLRELGLVHADCATRLPWQAVCDELEREIRASMPDIVEESAKAHATQKKSRRRPGVGGGAVDASACTANGSDDPSESADAAVEPAQDLSQQPQQPPQQPSLATAVDKPRAKGKVYRVYGPTTAAQLFGRDGSFDMPLRRVRRRWVALLNFEERTRRRVIIPREWVDQIESIDAVRAKVVSVALEELRTRKSSKAAPPKTTTTTRRRSQGRSDDEK